MRKRPTSLGVSSNPKPKKRTADANNGCVVSGGLLIAGGESSTLLEQVEGTLDVGARFVLLAVEVRWLLSVLLRGNHRASVDAFELGSDFVAVVGLVAEQLVWLYFLNQRGRRLAIMSLAYGHFELVGEPEGVDDEVNLRRCATARAPNGLFFGPPFSTSGMLVGSVHRAVETVPLAVDVGLQSHK